MLQSQYLFRARESNNQFLHFVAYVWLFALGLAIVLLREVVVPAHFRFDSDKIEDAAQGRLFNDYSFDTVGALYRVFGLADNETLAGVLSFVVLILLTSVCLRRSGTSGLRGVFMFGAIALLGGVYLGGYSKDAFVLIIVGAIVMFPSRRRWDLLVVAIIIWYATYFRQYWYLVAVAYVAFLLIQRATKRPGSLLLFAVFGIILASLALWLVLGVDPDSFRSFTNENRGETASSTVIQPFISTWQPLSGVVNNVLTFFSLIIPLPLMLRGDPYYLLIAALLVAIWAIFSRALIQRTAVARTVRNNRAIALVVGFAIVQALFEPDYGSALRHLVPLLPLFIAVAPHGTEGIQIEERHNSSTRPLKGT